MILHNIDEDEDELFLWYGWLTKGVQPYFQLVPLSEILTIMNLWHVASRVSTCAEPEFRLSWMNLWSSDNHYTTAPYSTANYSTLFLLKNFSCKIWFTKKSTTNEFWQGKILKFCSIFTWECFFFKLFILNKIVP